MVKIAVDLTEKEQKIIDTVKAEFGLNDNNQALTHILKWYKEHELKPKLCSRFVAEIEEARKSSKFVKVRNFSEEFSNE